MVEPLRWFRNYLLAAHRAEDYKLDLTLMNGSIDQTFRFVLLDHDEGYHIRRAPDY